MKYCPDCGAKIEITNHVPKFCASCGASLAGGSVATQTSKPIQRQQRLESESSEDEQRLNSPERGWDKDGIDADMPDMQNFKLELEKVESHSVSCRHTNIHEIANEAPGQFNYGAGAIRQGIKKIDKDMNKK